VNLALRRRWLTDVSTVGELYVDGVRECFILEDVYRPPPAPKIPGATCIPCGTYEVRITHSPRFSALAGHDVELPLLIDVPGFEGVRIHPGNTALDTEGCLLPGLRRHGDAVEMSRVAFTELLAKLRGASGPILLTITVEPDTTERPTT
jgi:hypothetical protein